MHRFVRRAAWVLLLVAVFAALVSGQVEVKYYGHSCFTIQESDGPIIMLDPYATFVKYTGLPQPADIVLMTHGHIDHCPYCFGETDQVAGDPVIVQSWNSQGRIREGDWQITEDLLVRFTEASHVTSAGGGAGVVALVSFEVAGIRFAHLGDLGKPLTSTQVQALEEVQVLFLPVGGTFTVDALEAMTVIGQLENLSIVFPMHYFVADKTPWTDIAPLSSFRSVVAGVYSIQDIEASEIELTLDTLPETVEVWVLDYAQD